MSNNVTEQHAQRKPLNTTEAAYAARVSESQIVAALESGELAGRRVRHQWVIDPAALASWVRGNVAMARLGRAKS